MRAKLAVCTLFACATARADTVADTGIASRDDVLEVPAGGGLAFRYHGFVTDVRGTFRATRDSRLVLEEDTRTFAPLHSWAASLSVGYEL